MNTFGDLGDIELLQRYCDADRIGTAFVFLKVDFEHFPPNLIEFECVSVGMHTQQITKNLKRIGALVEF